MTGSSRGYIIGRQYSSLQDIHLFQTTQVLVHEISETQSIPETVSVRVGTPSVQTSKPVQSQISSIPETEFDSNQNPVLPHALYELHGRSQRASTASIRGTRDSNFETSPVSLTESPRWCCIVPFSKRAREAFLWDSHTFGAFWNRSSNTSASMENNQDGSGPPKPDVLEKYSHIPGSTSREKVRNMYAQLQANFPARPLQSISASATPSSAGDIEPAAVSAPGTTSPLSIRVDKEPTSHAAPAEIHEPPAQEYVETTFNEYHEPPVMQTIQPSDLTVGPAEEAPPGSVQLGPSEFAMTLPMDSRVKDEYERILTDESHVIRNFHSLFTSESSSASIEVS